MQKSQDTQKMQIGRVAKAQGICGEIKVIPETDDPNRYKRLKQCYIKGQGEGKIYNVTDVRVAPDAVYLKLAEVADRNAAELLRGSVVLIDREKAVKLDEGRYFIIDLVGCAVHGSDGRELGILREVLQHGAADVYVVKGEKSFMVPAIKKLLLEVDVAAKRIVLDSALLPEVAVYED